MARNKSTVGVLVYLYILFIATVELLALIQPSYCTEASDDQQNEEKDDNYLQLPSLSYDDFEAIDSKADSSIDPQQQQLKDHSTDIASQGHALQEEASLSDLDAERVDQNSAEGTGDYDAFVSPSTQQHTTLSSSAIKASIKVECEPFYEDLDEEERKEKAAVRLVNSSQIFAYLDRIHGTVADVNDTETKKSRQNNNSSNFTSSPSNSADGGEESAKVSTASVNSVQGGQSNHVTSDNVTDNISTNESNVREENHGVTVNASSHCALVLFYYPWCIFSAKAAPAFNAIGRIFPQIRVMALDSYSDTGLNMRFGLVGVPTILFFHNSKLIAKYNETDVTPEGLLSFIHKITGLTPVDEAIISPADLSGPVPTQPVKTIDYVALISGLFVFLVAVYFLVNSVLFSRFVEFIRSNWREAQAAQHEHSE